MKLKLNILRHAPFRNASCIAFILFLVFSFSVGAGLAISCTGGPDCLSCATGLPAHAPNPDAGMGGHGCGPVAQNNSCGFETGRRLDEFHSIALVVGFDIHQYCGIFIAASDEFDPAHLHRVLISQFQYPDTDGSTPIYLLNHSLLC